MNNQSITRRQRCQAIGMMILMLTLMVSPAGATVVAGIEFPKNVKDEGVNMQLQGVGLKSVVFVKAFVAGLYKEEGATLATGAKNIKVRYFVDIPGKKLSRYTIESMKDNVTRSDFQSLSKEIDLMSQYFVDLKPGDTYELRYIPNIGTKFLHNGELQGVIEGEKFSQALYAVWIGQKPFDKKLKKQILGLDKDNTRASDKFARL